MANYASAVRRIRRNEKARKKNQHYRSMMKTAIKSVLSSKDKAVAEKQYPKTVSILDKMVTNGIIHRNKAANQKSRLALHINKM